MKISDKKVTSKNKGKKSEKSLKKLHMEKGIEFYLCLNLNSKNPAEIGNDFQKPPY